MTHVQGCKTILVVEDNEALLETFRFLLESEGYNVVTSKNGQEALEALEIAKHPCLILLDMFMPVMDGWQFLDQLKMREGDLLASLPIVITSAAGDRAEIAAKLVRGLLRKPFQLDALLKTVREFCGAKIDIPPNHVHLNEI